jgi:pimeloyl-ACP methyl ester carboxylesterase
MSNTLTEPSQDQTSGDRPLRSEGPSPDPRAVLAPFNGVEPPAPQWFRDAIAQEPERGFVTSHGTKLEVLTWGERGRPGLLLVHGNNAHADWWSFIAPYLARDYRVTAMSMAGMGASDWRDGYAFSDFADDAEACARATGLHEGGRKPVYIGHSFGGMQVCFTAMRRPEQMHAAVLVDTGFGEPPPAVLEARRKRRERIGNIRVGDPPSRVYPTLAEALARFRLAPPQPIENLYIADFIARRSLKRAPLPDGSGEGWTWKFDPDMWEKLDPASLSMMTDPSADAPSAQAPMVHLYGEKSRMVDRRKGEDAGFPAGRMAEIEIPDSQHHVLIDQPLALVAALRTLLAHWPA